MKEGGGRWALEGYGGAGEGREAEGEVEPLLPTDLHHKNFHKHFMHFTHFTHCKHFYVRSFSKMLKKFSKMLKMLKNI